MNTDQLYYAVGSVLTAGAVISLVATWWIERRDRSKAARAGAVPPHVGGEEAGAPGRSR